MQDEGLVRNTYPLTVPIHQNRETIAVAAPKTPDFQGKQQVLRIQGRRRSCARRSGGQATQTPRGAVGKRQMELAQRS